jgi:mono/diheme cytochrome c family protein
MVYQSALRSLVIGLVIGVLLAPAPSARAAGDVREGKRVAEQWCSGCHVTDRSGRQRDTAPAFAVLANDPAKSAQFLKTWISNPHPPMPNFNLTRRTVDDLVAYIRSLSTNSKGIRKK